VLIAFKKKPEQTWSQSEPLSCFSNRHKAIGDYRPPEARENSYFLNQYERGPSPSGQVNGQFISKNWLGTDHRLQLP
jgi:hypothetical protein